MPVQYEWILSVTDQLLESRKLKQQQDAEYKESLRIDSAKEKTKHDMEQKKAVKNTDCFVVVR